MCNYFRHFLPLIRNLIKKKEKKNWLNLTFSPRLRNSHIGIAEPEHNVIRTVIAMIIFKYCAIFSFKIFCLFVTLFYSPLITNGIFLNTQLFNFCPAKSQITFNKYVCFWVTKRYNNFSNLSTKKLFFFSSLYLLLQIWINTKII